MIGIDIFSYLVGGVFIMLVIIGVVAGIYRVARLIENPPELRGKDAER